LEQNNLSTFSIKNFEDNWILKIFKKCDKKFKNDGSDYFLTTSVVIFVLGSILGLFWRYEYKPRWSPI
jgi:hypothetical protein